MVEHNKSRYYGNNYKFNGKEIDNETGNYYYGARYYDPRLSIFLSVDPLVEQTMTPYQYCNNNPVNLVDPTGMVAESPDKVDDWVKRADGSIYWDKNANDQASTKAGETYLDKTLNFTFNSFIDGKYWDGPRGEVPLGDKLTSSIFITGIENETLNSVLGGSSYVIGETPVDTVRNYYPGEGGSNNHFNQQNSFVDGKFSSYSLDFEQHASVPKIEEFGLGLLGYILVDVAQKLNISVRNNNLSFSASTNIFPSAILDVNGSRYMHYIQPSFKKTHRTDLFYKNRKSEYFPSNFYKRY